MNAAVVDFINVHRDRYVDELKQFLAIPSVSALPEHAGDVRRAAEWAADSLRSAGMENVRAHLEKLKLDGRAFEDNGTWTTSSTSST